MNPLLSFWIKVQPLSGGLLGSHTWKAISQSSALARAEDWDEPPVVAKRSAPSPSSSSSSSSSWAYDALRIVADRLSSRLQASASSWLLNPVIMRMHDLGPRPSRRAICEADRPGFARETAKVGVGGDGGVAVAVDPKRFAVGAGGGGGGGGRVPGALTPLQLSHEVLQRRDSIRPPTLPPVRRNSGEWVREYRREARIDKINYNNIFGGLSDPSNNEIPALHHEDTGYFAPVSPVSSSRSSSTSASIVVSADAVLSLPSPPSGPSSPEPCLSSAISLDESRSSSSSPPTMLHRAADPPCTDDVICGRGGKANTHPGNVSFREEARKLRGWYESSSKSEKFTISSFLVDVVRERGGRFLKRDGTVKGGWLEADGDDVRKKASQALREGRCR